MPELPEVETVRRGLECLVVGKTIEQVWRASSRPDKESMRTIIRTPGGV